ncbi:MAG: hypothetical protein KA200_04670 [Burkholderiales bacterium]|jgi:hypothetical protein|nr:hypothetical protein [Burkholderiales bacterium]
MPFCRSLLSSLVAGTLALVTTAPVSAQQCVNRAQIMICGDSGATGSSLYQGAGPFPEVSGCAPDANTQALFVTRDGSTAGNGGAWLAYLNAGGRIITEYSRANNVYNEIYGTAYPDAAFQFGDCSDNAMPSLKLNPGDPFWVQNPFPVTASNVESCGEDDLAALVAGEGSVTPLGGLVDHPGSVTFARRVQGSGILWLLDADWQDGGQNSNSASFMGALITDCSAAPAINVKSTPVPVDHPLAIGGLAALIALLGAGFARLRRSRSRAI